jgi:hypothetical protein
MHQMRMSTNYLIIDAKAEIFGNSKYCWYCKEPREKNRVPWNGAKSAEGYYIFYEMASINNILLESQIRKFAKHGPLDIPMVRSDHRHCVTWKIHVKKSEIAVSFEFLYCSITSSNKVGNDLKSDRFETMILYIFN